MGHDTFRIFQEAYAEAKKMPASAAFANEEKEEKKEDITLDELEKILAPILLD